MTYQPQHAQIRNPNVLCVDLMMTQSPTEVVRACLMRSGLRQAEFAKIMGVSPATLSEWLTDTRPAPALASRGALMAMILIGVPIQMPNPSQYLPTLSTVGKRRAKR